MRLKNNLSCAPVRLFLLFCLWAVSLNTMADSGAWYFTESKGFTWMTVGDCEIEYSIPVFIWDSSSNDAVTWGYIYVTSEGESETSILYYAYDESRDQDKPATFQAQSEGDFKIVNTTSGIVSFNRNSGSVSYVLKRDADEDGGQRHAVHSNEQPVNDRAGIVRVCVEQYPPDVSYGHDAE